ncbi:Aconitate hydratase [Cucumis melo var. makuwa]|uniref:Aconitate hydratase n=1 Tax=Cucumis melo var. makuwa TaxID=1194695 RepID=A0A5A7TTS9_CUCMM|nr:Aconitate hydratase [Cucumis melo var. makuwa]TYK16949.1 Aconitate hydratase [Cucumis melo var. makuwa]
MATGRLIYSTSLHGDFETMNMDGKNRDGSRLLSTALPRGGNYINNPHAAEKAAVRRSGYQP